jgi:osmotically-inducible protein OsmY
MSTKTRNTPEMSSVAKETMKKHTSHYLFAAAVALPACLLISGCHRDNGTVNNPGAAAPTADAVAPGTNVDNTAINARDRDNNNLTAGDQGTSEADRETTRKIRRALVGDTHYSMTAKNVKIITTDGKVTLRGPVKNDGEKSGIENIAKEAAGADSLDNQLEVETNQ